MSNTTPVSHDDLININIELGSATDAIEDLGRLLHGIEFNSPHLNESIYREIKYAHESVINAHKIMVAFSPKEVVDEFCDDCFNEKFFYKFFNDE